MESVHDQIATVTAQFKVEADKHAAGNKAAGVRARKLSLQLSDMHKAYRKASTKE